MDDTPHNFSYLNNSNLNSPTQEIKSQLFDSDIENINNNRNHYLCTQCSKFPYIKFCKDRKNIRITCSCFNNKKILIKDLFEKNILSIENISNINFLSLTNLNLNDDIENQLKCNKHSKIFFNSKHKFEGFSKIYLEHYCQHCIYNKNKNDLIIKFDDIKIEDIKIKQLLNKKIIIINHLMNLILIIQ